jgi:hypothetical protein
VAVAAGVLVVPAVGVVPVPAPVELLPQAASITSALSATRKSKTGLTCRFADTFLAVIDLFKSIVFLLSKWYFS